MHLLSGIYPAPVIKFRADLDGQLSSYGKLYRRGWHIVRNTTATLLTPDFGLDVYSDRLSKVSVASSGVLALVRQATCILDCILRRACILGSPKSQSPAEPRPSPPCTSEASSAVFSKHLNSVLSELEQG